MAKKQYLSAEAERLFVSENCTLKDIERQLNGQISVRQLSNWKEEFGWEDKKRKYLESKQSFHEELYVLARKLGKSISDDIDNGNKPDQGRLFTLAKIIPLITKAKDYEKAVQDAQKAPEDERLNDEELMMKIEEIIKL
ncbi:MAG: hypothetical protein PHE67_02595 [Campylobacterales bacterium]|nr:hypothetical protein [Campylobacterales bacterium]